MKSHKGVLDRDVHLFKWALIFIRIWLTWLHVIDLHKATHALILTIRICVPVFGFCTLSCGLAASQYRERSSNIETPFRVGIDDRTRFTYKLSASVGSSVKVKS